MRSLLFLLVFSSSLFSLGVGEPDPNNQCKITVSSTIHQDFKFISHISEYGQTEGCKTVYPIGDYWSGGIYGHEGYISSTMGWVYNPTDTGVAGDLYCEVRVKKWVHSDDTPTCPDGQMLNIENCQCIEETCPPGQYDSGQNSEGLDCICSDTGLRPLYDLGSDTYHCQEPLCPMTYEGLPLYATQATEAFCNSLTNDLLGFTSKYVSKYGLQCCYSDTYKADSDDCPPNYIKDRFGVCQKVSSSDNNESNETRPEIENPNNSADRNGTAADYNSSVSPNDVIDEVGNVVDHIPFDDDEFNRIFGDSNNELKRVGKEGLEYGLGLFLKMHTVVVPAPSAGSCGCNDYGQSISTPLGNWTPTFNVCQYLQNVLDVLKYLLKAFVVYLLFGRIKEII